MLYQFDNLNFLDVEITTYCNAFCGACDRNIMGGAPNPKVKLQHMSTQTWQALVQPKNLAHIHKITLDGNAGEATVHPELFEFLDMLVHSKPEMYVKITTNGGSRNATFWKDLASQLKKFACHTVTFALDGLEDTNHIYRRGVNWDKLISNIEAFNSNGGESSGRTIVFDHNKHQLDQIRDLAHSIGCFNYYTQPSTTIDIPLAEYKKLPAGQITAPRQQEFKDNYKQYHQFWKPSFYGFYKDYPDLTNEFPCKFGKERLGSMDLHGNLWPCCLIYSEFLNQGRFDFAEWLPSVNVKDHSIEHILNFIQTTLYSSWDSDPYQVCKKCISGATRL